MWTPRRSRGTAAVVDPRAIAYTRSDFTSFRATSKHMRLPLIPSDSAGSGAPRRNQSDYMAAAAARARLIAPVGFAPNSVTSNAFPCFVSASTK